MRGLLFLLVACESAEPLAEPCEVPLERAEDGCFFDGEASFRSERQHECGLAPNGVSLCHWTVSLDNGEWVHNYSDVTEEGTYRCEGDAVLLTGADTEVVWSDADARLTWDGVVYVRDCPEGG